MTTTPTTTDAAAAKQAALNLASRSASNEAEGLGMFASVSIGGAVAAYIPDTDKGREFAAMFSAAPELLAALEELITGHSMKGEAMARAAIAKARA